jgi:predicted  nucleic acid-binding Zn-ribbon protein
VAFEPSDFEELIQFLDAHPDLKDQLRRRILSDEFLRLPIEVHELRDGIAGLRESVVGLRDGIAALQEGVDGLLASIQELRNGDRELRESVSELRASIQELRDSDRELRESVSELRASVQELRDSVSGLRDQVAQNTAELVRHRNQLDRHEGEFTEFRFERRAPSYFGPWLRRPQVVRVDELGVEEALEDGRLAREQYLDLLNLDLAIRGGDKSERGYPQTVFAVEVSATVDNEDVECTVRRAEVLRHIGLRARPSVGGGAITARAMNAAEADGVVVCLVAAPA